jgi:NAD(P)-dependent dehydrogenase (short-subunit alcohol dehydrogenase family)
MKGAKEFLTEWRCGYYEHCKLANVLFAYELQRRLGVHGVTSCAVDPGGVRTNIWTHSPAFSKVRKGWGQRQAGRLLLPHAGGCEAGWATSRRCQELCDGARHAVALAAWCVHVQGRGAAAT